MTAPVTIDNADDAAIADWIEGRLLDALEGSRGRVAIALPGGSTPFPILELLAQREIEWDRVEAWPTDDRIVPEDHPASNTGRLRALLEPLGVQVTALSPDRTPPHFLLVWLGMGADGHVASLFPASDPQPDDPLPLRMLTPDPLPPEAPFDRVTLTIPALLDTDEILFVVRGADKRAVWDGAVAGRHDLPVARLLGAAQVPVTCFT